MQSKQELVRRIADYLLCIRALKMSGDLRLFPPKLSEESWSRAAYATDLDLQQYTVRELELTLFSIASFYRSCSVCACYLSQLPPSRGTEQACIEGVRHGY